MNWAPSNRKEFCRAVEKERFLKAESGQKKQIIRKECIVSGKVSLLRETEGWITSPLLTR